MEDLVELVYLSASTHRFGVTELRELLGASRRKNRSLGVTGLLLHADGSFLQVLEGPAAVVDGLYARICSDARHDHLVRVFRRSISHRSFGSWSMGFEEPLDAMRTELLGFSRILLTESALPESATGRVRAIVQQFAHGRWRQAEATESGPRLR